MAYPHHHGSGSWTERQGAPDTGSGYDDCEHPAHAQGFQHAHMSLGVAGHLVHMGAMLFPVLAAELIPDAEKHRKAVRIGAIATTVLYEGLYTMREAQRRHRQEEKLEEYRSEHAEHHDAEDTARHPGN
jgi:hypothetical protein